MGLTEQVKLFGVTFNASLEDDNGVLRHFTVLRKTEI